jgi:hypothetical protein
MMLKTLKKPEEYPSGLQNPDPPDPPVSVDGET